MSEALDRAIALLAKAQQRQDELTHKPVGEVGTDLVVACEDRDIFLADVVRLGLAHLRLMRELYPDSVIDFGDDDA